MNTRAAIAGASANDGPDADPERVLLRLDRRDGEIRVTASKFKGYDRIGIRFWFRGQDGETYPTQKGVSLRLDEASQVASAIDEAVRVLEGGTPASDPTEGW
jgi:hypothetical protein